MDSTSRASMFALMFCLLLLGCSSTQGGKEKLTLWERMFGKASDSVPGIMPPKDRIVAIQKMTQEAGSSGLAGQEQLAQKFATLYPQEGDPQIRLHLVRAAGSLGSPTAANLVRDAVKDGDADVRIEACKALQKQKGPETAATLAEVLGSDVDLDVRLTAARALGQVGDQSAVAALGSALEDSDPAMQMCAVDSLRRVAPQDLGDDVNRWRQYVKGEPLSPPKSVSIAERVQQMFRY